MQPDPSPQRATARTTCFGCRHFVIRHDPHWPYSCEHFGLRAQQVPALLVLNTSGVECQAFEGRTSPVEREAR